MPIKTFNMTQQKSNSESLPVAVVEDDSGLRGQLQRILASAPGFCCVGAYKSAEQALEGMVAAKPKVILMDINLPGISGIECVARLQKLLPDAHIIMLTIYEDSDLIFQALQAGAEGYLVKSSATDVLLKAIDDVHQGGAPMSSHIARKMLRFFRSADSTPATELESLSARELDVLRLLAEGLVNKEIADRLSLSAPTVATYIRRIYGKLHVRSRAAAIGRFSSLVRGKDAGL